MFVRPITVVTVLAIGSIAAPALAEESAPAPTPVAAPSSPARAPSEEPESLPPPAVPRFGHKGDFALSLSYDVIATGANNASVAGIANTEIDATYFVAQHLSLGLGVGASYMHFSSASGGTSDSTSDSSHGEYLELSPRVGYDLPIGEYVSFWPQVGFRFQTGNATSDSASFGDLSFQSTEATYEFAFTATAPVLIHPVRGFFFGAGPSFSTDLVTSAKSAGVSLDASKLTMLTLTAVIGGDF